MAGPTARTSDAAEEAGYRTVAWASVLSPEAETTTKPCRATFMPQTTTKVTIRDLDRSA